MVPILAYSAMTTTEQSGIVFEFVTLDFRELRVKKGKGIK